MTLPAGVTVPNPAPAAFPGSLPQAPAPAPQAPQNPYAPQAPVLQQPAPQASPAPHPTVPEMPAQPQPQALTGPQLDAVIQAGPGVPQELVGRTYRNALQMYNALAQDYTTRNRQPVTAAPQAPTAPAPAVPAGQPANGTVDEREFFAKPLTTLRTEISKIVNEALNNSPASQNAAREQAASAARQAAQTAPDIGSGLMPHIQAVLAEAGVDPITMTTPAQWLQVADLARGRAMRLGQYTPAQAPVQQPQAQPNGAWGAAGGHPGGSVPAQAGSLPAYAFFAEAPTANGNTLNGAPGVLTAEDKQMAAAFGMGEDQFLAWKQYNQSSARRY